MKRQAFLILIATLLSPLMSFAFDYTVSFDYSKVTINEIEHGGANYSEILYNDLVNCAELNKPSLPVMQLKISVPYNATNIKLSVKPLNKVTFTTDYPLLPVFNELAQSVSGKEIISQPSEYAITARDSVAHISCIGYAYGGHKIVTVNIYPIVGSLNSTKANFYGSVRLNCTWTCTNDLSSEPIKYIGGPMVTASIDKVKGMVINPEDVNSNCLKLTNKPLSLDPDDSGIIDYLIIAPDEFCEALQELKQIRRMKGYRSEIVPLSHILESGLYLGDDIGPTLITDDAGKLRKYLLNRYENDGVKNVLLAGKFPKMPIRYIKFDYFPKLNPEAPSDIYFSDLTTKWEQVEGDLYICNGTYDYDCEIAIGRIPFETIDEINNYLSKLKIYEFNPGNGDPSYLGKALITRQRKDDILAFFDDYVINNIKEAYSGNAILLDNLKGSEVINKLRDINVGSWHFVGHGSPDGIMTYQGSQAFEHGGLLALDGEYVFMNPENSAGIDKINNKYFPNWQYSISCTLMPFDTYNPKPNELYNVKKNFGESYILGKDYGGVVMIGNTRPYWLSDGRAAIRTLFPKLTSYYSNTEITDILTAGNVTSQIRTYPLIRDGRTSVNLFGDPLVPLFIKEPNKLRYANSFRNNKEVYKLSAPPPEKLFLASMDLNLINSAEIREVNDNELTAIDIYPNKIQTIYGKNSLPLILPVHLYGVTFYNSNFFCNELYIQNYITTTLKQNTQQIFNNGKVLIAKDNKLKIHAMGFTFIDDLLQLSENSTFELYCDNDVEIDNVYVPKGAKLIINARNIFIGDYGVQKHSEGYVELISREQSTVSLKTKSRSTVRKKLAIEGRTWWYKSEHMAFRNEQEFGIRIGEETKIGAEIWNKVFLCMYSEPHHPDAEVKTLTDTVTIGYIKDDGMTISSMAICVPEKCISLTENSMTGQHLNLPYQIYSFGEAGSHGYYGADVDELSQSYIIKNITELSNSGNTFRSYHCLPLDNNSLSGYLNQPFEYIEGIGHPQFYMLFPFCNSLCCMNKWDRPILSYVTDGDDNRVIYVATGGKKLWEQAGVENIAVNCDKSEPEWFDLRGVKIDYPTAPGIYIRRVGSRTEKVIR